MTPKGQKTKQPILANLISPDYRIRGFPPTFLLSLDRVPNTNLDPSISHRSLGRASPSLNLLGLNLTSPNGLRPFYIYK